MTDTPPAKKAPKPKRSRFKAVLTIVFVLALIVAGLWLFGPRTPVDTALRFDSAMLGDDLDAYLARSEAAHNDIVAGTEKQIVWAFPVSRSRTPVALVSIHGFSASKGELRPVPDMAAEQLQANLYFTRLAGHGRSDTAMAEPTVQDWLDDVAEAIAIGERLGERVVLLGTSTGGTLAAVAALHADLADRIDGVVFVSPNFRLKAAGHQLLTVPFARQIVPLLVGNERGFEPRNELHAQLWTEHYPSSALLPMAALTGYADTLFYENADIPALFIFSDADTVVDHVRTRQIAERWGADAEIVAIETSDDPDNHVIAGDALSPSTNAPVARLIADWVAALP